MTIIAAGYDQDERCVWLGCNSKSQLGSLRTPGAESKWVMAGDWVCAFTGAALHSDLLTASLDDFPKNSSDRLEVLKYFLKLFEEFNIGEADKESKDYGVSGLLVHRDGRIWDFDTRLAMTAIPLGEVWFRGSGMELAQGAVAVLHQQNAPIRACVEKAVEIAIQFDCDCPGDVMMTQFPAKT